MKGLAFPAVCVAVCLSGVGNAKAVRPFDPSPMLPQLPLSTVGGFPRPTVTCFLIPTSPHLRCVWIWRGLP